MSLGIILDKGKKFRMETVERTDTGTIIPSTISIAMTASLRVIIMVHVTNGMVLEVMKIGTDPYPDKVMKAVAGVSLPGRMYHRNSRDLVITYFIQIFG